MVWSGRFPRNDIISLLDNYPVHNLGESTSQDLTFGDIVDLIGLDALREVRLGYGSAAGSPTLRARIAELTGVGAEQVITTQGVALGLYLLAVEHCRPGDEVVIVTPAFPPTRDAMSGSGVSVTTVPLAFDDGYRIDAGIVARALTSATRLVCIATPQNPSGVTARPDDVGALLAQMRRVCPTALLLVDEIYRDAAYGDAPIPPSFAPDDPRIVTSGSISKAHGAPGLRCGWLTVHDPDLRDRLIVAKMNIVLSGSVLDEAIAVAILESRDRILRPRRELLAQALALVAQWQDEQCDRVDWIRPDGGAMCCVRLRSDAFDDDAVRRFWTSLPGLGLQLGNGEWFGESARIARLGFGYLPLDRLSPALEQLTAALDAAASANRS
ncbi:MAG: aminotransferase [Ilumatobacteraceae bacterium]|nr:aminotransferase [Ilumatobacteraceae bacterium]